MERSRQLWLGPPGAPLTATATAELPPEGLWIVPTPLAKRQATVALARRSGGPSPARVWTWDDVWAEAARTAPTPIPRLTRAGQRALLAESIASARRQHGLSALRPLLDWPGFRRRLLDQFAAWTLTEFPDGQGPELLSEAERQEWVVFEQYRDALKRAHAYDDASYIVRASRSVAKGTGSRLLSATNVIILDLADPADPHWRLLKAIHETAESIVVTLPIDDDPGLSAVHQSAAAVRERFANREYQERWIEDESRPVPLVQVATELFREPPRPVEKAPPGNALTVLGAPRGDGVGKLVAREVRRWLRAGYGPEEIAVAVPRWDDDAEDLLLALQAAKLPVRAERPRPLASEPALAALRLALKLPAEGWERGTLMALLRNRLITWDGDGLDNDLGAAEAAAVLREARVYRGLDALLDALEELPGGDATRLAVRSRAKARAYVDHLKSLHRRTHTEGPWFDHVARMNQLARNLGLSERPEARVAIETFQAALDDYGEGLDAIGRGTEEWSFEEFDREIERLLNDLSIDDRPDPSAARVGTIAVATAHQLRGCSHRILLIANLGEGVYPTADALQADSEHAARLADNDAGPAPVIGPRLGREMSEFLRLVGSASDHVSFVYPCTDADGQELLRSGFLDELVRFHESDHPDGFPAPIKRLDPVLRSTPDLVGNACDLRVRAVALAYDGSTADLEKLAAHPRHREVLLGAADALELAAFRARGNQFGPYDGRIHDVTVINAIARSFGPEHPFSASQLETYAACPFQFFLRYPLGIVPVYDLDEFDEDRIRRGSGLHDLLENLHLSIDPSQHAPEAVRERVEHLIEHERTALMTAAHPVSRAIQQIDLGRLERTLRDYAGQYEKYTRAKYHADATPHRFELEFGTKDAAHLKLDLVAAEGESGEGLVPVMLQGKIDRVDLVHDHGRVKFRVIDYKTGHCPSSREVHEGVRSQLPLYAMAVQYLDLLPETNLPHDVGYWGLAQEGFKLVKLDDWDSYRKALRSYILELVQQIRSGGFPVLPHREENCRYCDYRTTCRQAQTKKTFPGQPKLERDA